MRTIKYICNQTISIPLQNKLFQKKKKKKKKTPFDPGD